MCVQGDDGTELKAGRTFQGRDVEKMLNFPTTEHSAEMRRWQNQRRGEIHRNSSGEICKLRYNSRTAVKSSDLELLIVVRPSANITHLHFPVESSKSELSSKMQLKWYKKPDRLLHALLFKCSNGKWSHYGQKFRFGTFDHGATISRQNFWLWCN